MCKEVAYPEKCTDKTVGVTILPELLVYMDNVGSNCSEAIKAVLKGTFGCTGNPDSMCTEKPLTIPETPMPTPVLEGASNAVAVQTMQTSMTSLGGFAMHANWALNVFR